MSTTVDQRVVEMRFDNKQFESGVSTTMSTLEKLKKSLHLDGASKSLSKVSDAMDGTRDSLKQFEYGAYQTGFKWSDVLHKISSVAEWRIAQQAIMGVESCIKNLANAIIGLPAIKTGLQEYETQIGAIQTILANTESKGTTLDDVNGALDELNTYADKTIYNFTEMTRNIGTFTAAGVDLDKSVSSIKGIANLAAISGSTSQQASTAMYQLSQAMASGTVKLMDWNSVVNAGMGGQVFQDALKRTAKAHGIAIDDIIEKNGSFRESLSDGWLTADILTETLTHFTMAAEEGSKEWEELKASLKDKGYTDEQAESILKMANTATGAATEVKTFTQLWDTMKESAQSGWAQTWEIIIGDFEEAKEFLTELSDLFGGIIGKSAESRNDMLENWKVLGGRDDLLQSLRNSFDAIASVIKPISEAFREIFPPMTAEQLKGFTEGLKNLTANLILSDETSENLKRTFRGLFAVVDIVRQIFVAVFKAIGSVLGVTGKLGGGILSITAVFGDWLVQIRDAITYSNIFENVFSGVASLVRTAIRWFGQLAETISGSFVFEAASAGLNSLMALLTRTSDGTNVLAESAAKVKEAWMQTGLYQFLVKVWDVIKTVVSGIAKIFTGMFTAISEAFGSGDFESGFDLIKALLEGGLLVALTTLITKIKGLFSESGGLMDSLKDLVDNASGIIDSFGDALSAFQNKLKADALKSLAVAIAVLVASIVVLSFIDTENLSNALAAITVLFVELSILLTAVSKINGKGDTIQGFSGTIIALGIGLLLMATTMKILSDMDPDGAKQGFLGVAALLTIMTTAVVLMSKFANENKAINQGARAMVVMGIALLAISGVIAILGSMETEKLIQGGLGLLGVLTVLVAAQSIMQLIKQARVVKGAQALLLMALTIALLIPPLLILGFVPWEKVLQGGLGLLGILTILVGAQSIMQLFKNAIVAKGASALTIITAALLILLPTLMLLALMPWTSLIQGSLGLLGILTVLVGAQSIMQLFKAVRIVKGAAALTIMASSFLIILPPLMLLALMPWQSLMQGGLAMIALMTLMVGAQAVMQLLNPAKLVTAAGAMVTMATSILILAPALLLLGSMGIEAVGVALAAIAGAFIVMGVAAKVLQPVIPTIVAFSGAALLFGLGVMALGAAVLLFGLGLSAVAMGITALASGIGGLGVIVAEILEIIIVAIPKIGVIISELIIAVCDILIDCVPKIVDTVLIVVLEVLRALVEFIPSIVGAIVELIAGIINAIANELPGLIKAVVDLLFAFVNGVIEALGGMDAGGDLTKALMNTSMITLILAELALMKVLAVPAMVGVLSMAAVMAELAIVLAAFGALAQIPGLKWIIGEGGDLLEAIGKAIGQFIGGLIGGIAKGSTADLPEVGRNLSEFAREIVDFLKIAPELASISNSITSISNLGSIDMGVFQTELPKLGEGLAGFSDEIGDRSFDNIENAAKGAAALAEVANAIPNSGGWLGAICGENSIAQFGNELTDFAKGLAGFSDEIGDRSFDNIGGAVDAAKALADISNNIPNSGGMVSWFTGENAISKFGDELVSLGRGIANFSDAVADANLEKTTDAVEAAKALVDMTNEIPNTGGVVSWFTGENAISKYASELGHLGRGIFNFAKEVGEADLTKVKTAAEAATLLAEMTNSIPNEGGIAAWFAGESAIAKFGNELASLGRGILGFATSTEGINTDTIGPAVDAAVKLAEMTSVIPNEGGIGAWFSGESALAKFATELVSLGEGIAGFATATNGIDADTIGPAADAATKLAEMTNIIPNEGGIAAWFSGESALAKFASELTMLGQGMMGFSMYASMINPETIGPAADAAKSLAEMTNVIPKEGGIKAWFSGESAMAKFASELPALGSGLKGFSDSVAGIVPENVTAAASAAKSLGDMTSVIPKDTEKIVSFGDNLKKFGTSLMSYFSSTSGITKESVSGVSGTLDVVERISKIDSSGVQSIATAINSVVDAMKGMSGVAKDSSTGVKQALDDIAKVNVESVQKIAPDMKKAGKDAITAFAEGIKEAANKAKTACKDLATACVEAIRDKYDSFKSAGKYVAEGFADGIDANTFKAKAKAKAMAKAALEAAEEALDENSPSKEFYRIGAYGGEGFVNALGDYGKVSYNAGSEMAGSAKNGLQDAISKISDAINGDMDMQPTIRPVLDLSDVRSGVGTIGDLFGTSSVGVIANVNSISAMMNRRGQNGGNDEIVSAINKLNKKLDNAGNTYYNIDGVTYDDGSNIAGAVKSIVRAVKVERRT